jgi:hypothetical protein
MELCLPEFGEIPSAQLSTAAEIILGMRSFQSPYYSNPTNTRVPYLRISDISKGNVAQEGIRYVETKDVDYSKYQIKINDLLVSNTGTIGKVALAKSTSLEKAIASKQLFIVRAKPNVNPDFLFYVLSTQSVRERLADASKGTVIRFITRHDLESVIIPLPPRNIQDKIVDFIRRENIRARLSRVLSEEGDVGLQEMVQRDESDTLEFKPSLFVNYEGSDGDEYFPILKSIAGFMNSEGGTLLIGVDRENGITGITEDFARLKGKKDWDGWLKQFSDILSKYIRPADAGLVKVDKIHYQGKIVAKVYVHKATGPIYIRKKGANMFFIRSMNATKPILDLEEFANYLKDH